MVRCAAADRANSVFPVPGGCARLDHGPLMPHPEEENARPGLSRRARREQVWVLEGQDERFPQRLASSVSERHERAPLSLQRSPIPSPTVARHLWIRSPILLHPSAHLARRRCRIALLRECARVVDSADRTLDFERYWRKRSTRSAGSEKPYRPYRYLVFSAERIQCIQRRCYCA